MIFGHTPGISAAVHSKFNLPTCYLPVSRKFQCVSCVHHLEGARDEDLRLTLYGLHHVEGQNQLVQPYVLSFFYHGSVSSFRETVREVMLCDENQVKKDFINERRGHSPSHLKFFLLVFSKLKEDIK